MLPLIRPNPTPNNDRSILTAQSWFRIRRFPSGPKNINTMVERQRDMDSRLARTFFEFKKQTTIQISFSSLQFPAVTICNANPIRMSEQYLASKKLTDFLDSVALESLYLELDHWEPIFDTDDSEDIDEDGDIDWYSLFDDSDESEDSEDSEDFWDDDWNWFDGKRKKRQADKRKRNKNNVNPQASKKEKANPKNEINVNPQASEKEKSNPKNKNNVKSKSKSKSSGSKKKEKTTRSNNFFDDLNITNDDDDNRYFSAVDAFFHLNEEDSWEAESRPSGFYEIEQNFRQLFASEPMSVRAEMGHQMSDMLLQCSFAGRKCVARNFTRLLTTRYGNCYTLEYPKFISRRSGPSDGLQLKLFLETEDYMPGLSTSKGIQVVIHDQGTLPFPDDEGIAVKAGTATAISFRRVEVNRLGEPYDHCTPVDGFKNKYGIKYTRNTCQKVCQHMKTRSQCGCYDIMQQSIHKVIKIPPSLKPCTSKKELQCLFNISLRIEKESDGCNCYRPCT
ncbi:amiloride-sensitive sodium channel subunit gamma [Plakobranchus ocellatus]|uniref:Amiloride-sensitive sodium channel subunit gamma n=1 Tax=Plakobranchus ocellatus TaxID=259542 RepID=A0AAV4CM80_9GAST|nr:amiloride-sensitive sodium channel subunit gamma [Plakobranchus ocellatus]